ncbi:Metallo-hydrolase/oxidoreductase [Basidiobolus meristosporus CBS 931.73]|uniref:Zinc phosphodiesterase ELAC protein 2 n=1 Tax=Basidiobolus meristosporus CBS 931.73 TaxID=1314790 RepID=A0A1Y1Y732_9FUNG|nr:Metallo-hydrolase/oxidoreductase [Basidiobolus meristosporus CBS 931.73]|eukprot:ORX93536.1 Metallo-hydrolase/oxidoreductase [Basidiobolus meristosporus CBS 931.73]
MKSYIQILGTSTVDVTPSVVVHFDSQRYLFNCGEGTQRLCVEKKVRFAKLQNIFFTRINWENTGGVPGMMLTLADAGATKINLHGGPNLTHFIAATRHFIQRSSLDVGLNEDIQSFKDENLNITAVQLEPQDMRKHDVSSGDNDLIDSDSNGKRKRSKEADINLNTKEAVAIREAILKRMFGGKNTNVSMCKQAQLEAQQEKANKKNKPQASTGDRKSFDKLPRATRSQTSICYICRGPTVQGKLDAKAAIALGLKPGPDFGKLKNGQSVTTPDGTIIQPEQVVGPSRLGTVFMIIDCPSTDYIASLVKASEFQTYQGTNKDAQAHCIVHMLGNNVLEDEQYQEWMNSFGPETQHIVAHTDICSQTIAFTGSAKTQLKLSHMDNEIFPLPYFSNTPNKPLLSIPNLPEKTVEASSLLAYHTEPKQNLDVSYVLPPFDPESEEYKTTLADREDYLAAIKELKESLPESLNPTTTSGHDVVVTTLGTGSALPSKYRNVSSTAVTIPSVGSILLDAGEGTYGQLYRHLGIISGHNKMINQSLDEFLKSLKCIFVSHLHADHHLGVIRVLDKWNQLQESTQEQPLYIVAPFKFQTWLQEYSDIQEIGLRNIRFINAEELVYHKKRSHVAAHLEALKETLHLKEVKTTDVIHCPWSYGISLEHSEGWKLVYSGDTRPCDKLVQLGQGATLLIHEATFEDEMKQEAIEKRHSTTSEAVDVSDRMNSTFLLLTHFSQRYPQVPVFTDAHAKVGISFDLMNVRISDLPKLPRFVQPLKVLYANNEEMDSEEE